MLDCFEGIESDIIQQKTKLPTAIKEEHHGVSVKRYSNHRDTSMTLQGIEGIMQLDGIPDDLLDVLLAGELMHIGKNTSFGFGRYRIT